MLCYGCYYEVDVDHDLVEEEALQLPQSAINEGSESSVILSNLVALAPKRFILWMTTSRHLKEM